LVARGLAPRGGGGLLGQTRTGIEKTQRKGGGRHRERGLILTERKDKLTKKTGSHKVGCEKA